MIEIKNVTKKYGDKTVLNNMNLTIESGDIFAFVGHNGAGKTTCIKCMTDIIEFNNGDILYDGISIKDEPLKCKKDIAYIPDNPDLYEFLKGIDYLNFIADIFEIDSSRLEKINKYATEFDLKETLGNPISSYSHGMKQKLAIIGALIHEPKYIILDEPFVGLDPVATKKLKNHMIEITKKGTSIFFSTHVLEVAEKLCNKIAIIKNGKLIKTGFMHDVLKDKSLEDIFMELEDEKIS
ncbi:MAG: ABC transporter ATP-binding protein [Bacilli bacterium]|nr:ABC transporter ATP-binding protein [Bacilli bacterium]MDD4406489.1 ABC transporter ATP-binding protein [Bacilli bacterium]